MKTTGTGNLRTPSARIAELESALTSLIRRAALPSVLEATRRRAGVDLGRSLYSTLVRVAELDGGRLSDVAEALGLDVSTTSRHVARLVDDGYVDVTTDDTDGRARCFRPTAKGRRTLERVVDERRRHLEQLLHDWDPEDLATLTRGLERITEAFIARDWRT